MLTKVPSDENEGWICSKINGVSKCLGNINEKDHGKKKPRFSKDDFNNCEQCLKAGIFIQNLKERKPETLKEYLNNLDQKIDKNFKVPEEPKYFTISHKCEMKFLGKKNTGWRCNKAFVTKCVSGLNDYGKA